MTHVITEPCIGTKDTACVVVCPVDCIPKDPNHVESKEQLQAKAEKLIAAKG